MPYTGEALDIDVHRSAPFADDHRGRTGDCMRGTQDGIHWMSEDIVDCRVVQEMCIGGEFVPERSRDDGVHLRSCIIPHASADRRIITIGHTSVQAGRRWVARNFVCKSSNELQVANCAFIAATSM